jgi:hypothetical protein
MSATLYGAVDTLEVKESESCQHMRATEEMDRSPMLLLNRTPSSSLDASPGNFRP